MRWILCSTLAVSALMALASPGQAQYSFDTASISAANVTYLSGSSVTVNGNDWTLNLPSFSVGSFDSGEIDLALPLSASLPFSVSQVSYHLSGTFGADDSAAVTLTLQDAFSANSSTASPTLPADSSDGILTLPAFTQSSYLTASIVLNGVSNGAALGTIEFTALPSVPEASGMLALMLGTLGSVGLVGYRRRLSCAAAKSHTEVSHA